MVEIKAKDAKYYYELNFVLYLEKEGQCLVCGNKEEYPKLLETYLSQADKIYIKKNKKNRFYKYLAGQIFIGYYLFIIFGLICGLFTFIGFSSKSFIILPFILATGITSFVGYKIASVARKRLTVSLNKIKRKKS